MALPLVHLCTAHAALAGLHICDLPSYYLGAIAPDGIHMLEGWTSDDKERSHLCTRRSRDKGQVRRFLEQLPEFQNRDYALGYAVHVLTDIDWYTVADDFSRRYNADPAPALERKPAYYSDTDQLDIELYHNWPQREAVWRELERAHGCELPGVLPLEAATLWARRTLGWYDEPREYPVPVRYISMEQITGFVEGAGQSCAAYIRQVLDHSDR